MVSMTYVTLKQPIEVLEPLNTYRHRIRLLPKGYNHESRDADVVARCEKAIERVVYCKIHDELPVGFPNLTREEIVFSAVTFEDVQIEDEWDIPEYARRLPDRWIEGTVTVYRKKQVCRLAVEEY